MNYEMCEFLNKSLYNFSIFRMKHKSHEHQKISQHTLIPQFDDLLRVLVKIYSLYHQR